MDLELSRRPLALPLALTAVARRRLLAAYLVALAPGLLLALTQPMWSRVDEAQQADFVSQLAHGVYPVEAQTTLQPEIAALTRRTGIYRWDRDGQPFVPTEAAATTF